MYIENKKMYHYHTPNNYDELWQVGNELIVDDKFKSNYYNCIVNKTKTGVITTDKKIISFNRIIEDYMSKNDLINNYQEIKILDDDNLKIEAYKLHILLDKAYRIIADSAQQNREIALEKYRRYNYPNLPSRAHSIWVIDEEQLDFWGTKLIKNSNLFELNLTGELFKSCDDYLPNEGLSINDAYALSDKYWNPDLEHINNDTVEYLFQGHAKILRRIK